MNEGNKFFEETLKGLEQAVQISKGETGTVEVQGLPAKTYRALNSDDVHRACELAKELFVDKVDLAGVSYINHPMAVASLVNTDTEKIVAHLHDVLEDTDYPEEKMRLEFGDKKNNNQFRGDRKRICKKRRHTDKHNINNMSR